MTKPKQTSKTQHRIFERIFENITTFYIVLLLTVFLFFCGTQGYQGIFEAKAKIFFLICGGYIIISFLLALEGVIIGEIKPPPLNVLFKETTWFQRAILIYIILTWISALLSPYGPISILGATRHEGALTITIYGLSCVFASKFGRLNQMLYYIFLTSSVIFSVLCIFQLRGGNPFLLYPEGHNYSGAYVDYAGAYLGTIGNVDAVAAYLAMEIPLLWGIILKKAGSSRFLSIPPLILAIYVLLKMSVLAGIVGVIAGILIPIPILLPLQRKYRRIAWGVLAASAIVFAALLYAADVGTGMLHEVHELLHGNIDPDFGSGRIHIWGEVLRQIPEHLWLGTGPDTMFLAGLEGFSRYDSIHGINIASQIDVAHNEYLNILFHQGIFALAAYIAILGISLKKWLSSGYSNPMTAIFGSAALGYCVQAFFGFSICITAPFFWLILGLINGPDGKSNGGIRHEKEINQP